MCEEDGHDTNTYVAHKYLEQLRGTPFDTKLTDDEVMSYLMPVTYNNETDAWFLSGGIKDVGGLVKLLVDVIRTEED